MPTSLIPFPSFDPVLISIGPFAIRWYALAYICGILLGWRYARAIIANERYWGGPAPMTVLDYDDFILWVTLGIILGGRAGYVLFYNLPHFLEHPIEILQVWKGGISFHGGFLGCVVAVISFANHRRIPALSLGDVTCAVGPIGLLLGRLASCINGELWGRVTDVPWAMIFPRGGPLPRHPSQLYQAFFEGVVVVLVLLAVWRLTDGRRRPGLLTGVFCFGYGVARIVGELFREPDAHLGYLLGQWLTMGMLLSVPLLAFGSWVSVRAYHRAPGHG